jgi:hypothetical protein
MTEAFKTQMRGRCTPGAHLGLDPTHPDDPCIACSTAHIEEFGDCVGVVSGLTDYNNVPPGHADYESDKVGPELDVRWEPSGLRYAYALANLRLES